MVNMAEDRDSLARSAFRRGARLASLPLGFAGRATIGLGKRLGGTSAEVVTEEMQQRAAEQLFRVLGELKGGAMKFGQALSLFESALPEDMAAPYRAHLTRLQDSAPPMPTSRVHAVLARELGAGWRDSFRSFEPLPAAAASIGQVHRAVWADGRTVAVKVQYPGADEALRSDLKQIGRMSKVMAPLAGGMDVKPLVDELTARVSEELDYTLEAASQQRAAEGFAGHPEFPIPAVLANTSRVLVSEWIEGTPMAATAEVATEEERNRIGLSYVRFLFAGPSLVGLLHADPHPGNFKVLDDGRLGVVDFGLVAQASRRPAGRHGSDPADRPDRGRGEDARRAARGGLRHRRHQRRGSARLPGSVRGAGRRPGVPVQPGMDARTVRTGQGSAHLRRRRLAAQPAAELPADPPGLVGRNGRAVPAERTGRLRLRPRGVPPRLRVGTTSLDSIGGARSAEVRAKYRASADEGSFGGGVAGVRPLPAYVSPPGLEDAPGFRDRPACQPAWAAKRSRPKVRGASPPPTQIELPLRVRATWRPGRAERSRKRPAQPEADSVEHPSAESYPFRAVAGRESCRHRLGQRVLPRPAPGTLARHHDSAHEQLAAPDTPRLAPLQRAGQAQVAHRAVPAQRLRRLDVGRRLGEEQIRVPQPAR